MADKAARFSQVIRHIGAEGLDRRGPAGSCRLFLGPGFRLGARWNRLVETVKTRKKREKTGKKWARYGLKRVKESGSPGSIFSVPFAATLTQCVVAASGRQNGPGNASFGGIIYNVFGCDSDADYGRMIDLCKVVILSRFVALSVSLTQKVSPLQMCKPCATAATRAGQQKCCRTPRRWRRTCWCAERRR